MNNDGIDIDSSSDTCLPHSRIVQFCSYTLLLSSATSGLLVLELELLLLLLLNRVIEHFYYDGGDDAIALKSGMCDVFSLLLFTVYQYSIRGAVR